MVTSVSEVGKVDRKFKGERKFKILTLLKWLKMESKLRKMSRWSLKRGRA